MTNSVTIAKSNLPIVSRTLFPDLSVNRSRSGRSKTPRSCVECRPAFGHLAQPIFTARYSGIGHYHWPIGSQSLIKPQTSNHHCVLSPVKPKILPAIRLQSRLQRWDVTKFLASSVASNHQTIQPLSLSQASGLAFGQRPIWPKTNLAKH